MRAWLSTCANLLATRVCAKPGAGVVTTRAHVRYVVTEFGAADLFGKSLRERASALVRIAHPAHREALERAAGARFGDSP